jgi:parallel beta-helix repeat protein
MTTTVFAVFVSVPASVSAGTAHAPIYIASDAEFLGPYPNADGVIGGSGTVADPYIISGWDIVSSSGSGITVYNTNVYFVIKNCNVSGATWWQGLDLENNLQGNVSNCNLIDNYYGIYSYGSPLEAFNNTISGGSYGIESDYSSSVIIRGNNISNQNSFGVYSYLDGVLEVRGNNISIQNNYGINVYGSKVVNIVDNSMNDVYCGIYLSNLIGGTCALLGNNISTCSWTAIYAYQSSNLKIVGNNLTDCSQTPYLDTCFDTQVFHNNIDYDSAQAYMCSADTWDNGYPSGGNYWVTASHTDAMSGVNQDVPGSDGICDTPVSFWDGAVDNYPLFTWFSGNVEPAASFTLSKRVINTTTALVMNASISIDAEDPLSDLQFRWDYDGDMAWDTGFSSTTNQSHTYATEGNYSVRLEVQDSGGLTSVSSWNIIVSDKAHATIEIDYDSGFTNPNATTGVTTGSGSIDDPYIISGWVIEASEYTGIDIVDTSVYFIIRDCQIYFGGISYSGIYLDNADNVKIESCTMMMNAYGIEAYYCNNANVTGCVATDNMERGIYFYESDYALITGNNASSNRFGIYMLYTANCIISNNIASYCGQTGIEIYDSLNNTALRNNASYNYDYGIVAEYSEQINIIRNEMIENSEGVYAYDVNVLNIVGNNITGTSSGGINIRSSSKAVAHHNNLFNLNWYANDPDGASTWDAGYPLGGNYWDVQTSPDIFSGPNQDVGGADGIVDVPYSLDADSQDNYPLTTPFDMSNLPPIAVMTTSARVLDTSTALDVDASASFDVEDPLSALEVRWDWESDGSWDTAWSTTKTGSHTYAMEGIYSITLAVRDTAGLSTSTTRTAIVSDMYRPTNIHIDGNSEFDVAHGVNGGGDGSAGNPYVIQNYVLDATNEDGIWIENTNKHFLIQNVRVYYGFSNSQYGIYLEYVQNGTVTLSSMNGSYYGIYAYHSGNLSISDCEFDDCFMSIYLYQTDFVLMQHISSDETRDNSLYFWSSCDYIAVEDSYLNQTNDAAISMGGSNPHDIIISNNEMNSVGVGVYADYANQLTIEDNDVIATSYGFEIYYSSSITISGNEISGPSYGMYIYDSDNALISNNVMNSVQYGVYANTVTQLTIEDSNVTASSYGFQMYYVDGMTMSRNEVFGSSYGIYFYDVQNTLVEYSYFNATTSYAMYLYYPTYVMIDNCFFDGNSNGIRIRYGDYVMVSNSTGKDVSFGVRIQDSTFISVRDNNFSGTTAYGVYVYSGVDQFEIIGNNLSGSSNGVWVYSSTNMNIAENELFNCNMAMQLDVCTGGNIKNNNLAASSSWGLYMTNCNGFKIAGNNFISNSNQAYDDSGGNGWNETALSGGGNYWSNYTYPDYNLDGFGDTPARVDADSIDYLPLMSPWIGNKKPVADFTVIPSAANISVSFSFDASLSTDNEDLTADLEVRWDWTNDGTYDTSWSTTKTATHSYTTPGIKTIKMEVRDTGGKTSTVTHSVTVSEGAPVTTAALNGTAGQNGWYISNVLVNLTATDDYSGVQWTKYKIDTGAWTTYTANFTISTEGTFVVQYYSQDISAINETTKSVTIKIDSVAPSISINQTSGMTVTKNYVVISWLGSDATSGLNRFEVSINGGTYVSVSGDMSYNFTGLTDGSYNVTVKAVDNAGHESTATLQFTVDIADTGGGGAISGDLLTYGLIIVIIIIVLIIVAVILKGRGKKPAPVSPPMPEPPAPPTN